MNIMTVSMMVGTVTILCYKHKNNSMTGHTDNCIQHNVLFVLVMLLYEHARQLKVASPPLLFAVTSEFVPCLWENH